MRRVALYLEGTPLSRHPVGRLRTERRAAQGGTLTQSDIDRGIVNIVVGFAPTWPADFVIISIQQVSDASRRCALNSD